MASSPPCCCHEVAALIPENRALISTNKHEAQRMACDVHPRVCLTAWLASHLNMRASFCSGVVRTTFTRNVFLTARLSRSASIDISIGMHNVAWCLSYAGLYSFCRTLLPCTMCLGV